MAEGLLRALAGDRYQVYSAGVEAGTVRIEAIAAMNEIGIDISSQRSKSVDEYAGESFDLVITTCDEAKEACPYFPGAARMEHWSFPDPSAVTGSERMQAFRNVRDGLRAKIGELVGVRP
jgi:arsenate reductase (thioredoxin)